MNPKYKGIMLYYKLIDVFRFSFNIDAVVKTLEKNGFVFNTIEDANKVIGIIQDAYNHTKLWDNNGFSPIELRHKSK
jgi:hypothetical protein